MHFPKKDNPTWAAIVTGKEVYTLKFLGAKILLSRLIRTVQAEPSSANVRAAVDELHALYTRNITLPSARDDIRTIFGKKQERPCHRNCSG